MEIRIAKVEDADQLVEMESLFLAPYNKKQVIYDINENPCRNYYVMEDKGEIVGFIDFWITFDSATIAQIAVKKEYQRQGIAERLIAFSINILKENEVLTYTLEVREKNLAALRLYEKLGFKKILVKPNYYSNGDNAIYMVKGIY